MVDLSSVFSVFMIGILGIRRVIIFSTINSIVYRVPYVNVISNKLD
jgi:hypothetical protein